ncbi:MAG: biosynthetic arginine decarboxylase [Candidatus Lambdaproteobacteria bacterium]|nr:biosynthetic arginine decarboxylase [Candidatus Lambdaproteobacteria bacterium]
MGGKKKWTAEDSARLYGLADWGLGYFSVNGKGNLQAHPSKDSAIGIDLRHLVEDAQAQGLSLPLLIRFSDILYDRVAHLRQCFVNAIEAEGYTGAYFGVYPIKVNQQRQVVEEVVRFGAEFRMGLEAGSKSELHAVLALHEQPEPIIVCNGHKDVAYVRLALMGQRLGKTVFLVVEKPAELGLILQEARETGIRPHLGIRIKLVTAGEGKWEDSGGDHSKFGLTVLELEQAVERLRAAGYLDCFRLIHIHIGSQVTNIRRIQQALREMARFHAELCKLGCPVDFVDVGGGLGVDYDGTRSNAASSINYTEQEYANDVVATFAETCRAEGLPHPNIVTESGRALTAHHAMLAINVLDTAALDTEQPLPPPGPDAPDVVLKLDELRKRLTARNAEEAWHDALDARDEISKRFELGLLSLHHRAWADQMFWKIATRVVRLARPERRPAEFARLDELLADKYFGNFSVFQSLPDSWAIGQQFPIVPLHRLREHPTRHGIVQDITCDSDGRIQRYIGRFPDKTSVPLHPLRNGEPYYLGVFLTGAYQEILGDIHNLFGDTDAIHVALNEDGTWRYEQIIHGESVARVLGYVQFSPDTLMDRIARQVQAAVKAGLMTAADGKTLRTLYATGLQGMTYLDARGEPGTEAGTGRGAAGSSARKSARRRAPKPPARAIAWR